MNQVSLLLSDESRVNYRTLFEQSQIPVALVSVRDGPHVVTASRAFLDTFDLRRTAVAGRGLEDLFVAGGDESLATAIHRSLATAESLRIDVELGGRARRLGLSGEVMQFKDFAARVHPDDLFEQPAYEVTRAGLADDEFATQTVRVRDRDGEWRLINLRTRVLRRGRDGAVRLLLGVAADITDYAAAAVE